MVDNDGKRHFGMKADTGFYRQPRPAKGYKQRSGNAAIVDEIRFWHEQRGFSEAAAIRKTRERLGSI